MLVLLSQLAFAQQTGAILTPEVAIDLAKDRPGEDAFTSRTRVRAWAKGENERDDLWFIEVRAQHTVYAGDNIEGIWDARVAESGWHGAVGPVDIRIGNLVERWGKLDFFPLVDVLSSRDLRNGVLTPQDWQRLAVPMAVIGAGSEPVRVELSVLPFSARDRNSMLGTDWSLIRQRMLEKYLGKVAGYEGETGVFMAPLIETLGENFASMDPTMRQGLDAAFTSNSFPQALGTGAEVALRTEFTLPGLDAAIMGGALRNRSPLGIMDPTMVAVLREERLPSFDEVLALQENGELLINSSWPRTWMAGLEGSTVVGAFGVRGEGLFLSDKVTRGHWLKGKTTPQVGAGLGVDYTNGSRIFASVEATYKRMLNPPNLTLLEPAEQLQIGGGVRVTAAQERLKIQLGGGYDVTLSEYMLRPTVSYHLSDHWEVVGGAALLGGKTPPPKTLEDALAYRGGPGSYFSQNDVATFAVSWIH